MPKSTATQPTEPTETTQTAKPARKRKYIFPDIDGGGPAVTIEAASLEEATDLYKKGQATA